MLKLIGRLFVVVVIAWAGGASAGTITDTVSVNGREWAQVDLFVGLSWNDINAVCPAGVCGSGTLNGFDMAGWSWASTDDLNSLFNHYIGFAALGSGVDTHEGATNTFAEAFFADGWRLTGLLLSSKITDGYTADSGSYWSQMFAFRDAQAICNGFGICSLTNYDRASTRWDLPAPYTNTRPGAWFQRTSTEVAGPATLPLFGLALAVLLGYSPRNRVAPFTPDV